MSEKEGRDIVMADVGCEMMIICRLRLEYVDGGSEVYDRCEYHVERKEKTERK